MHNSNLYAPILGEGAANFFLKWKLRVKGKKKIDFGLTVGDTLRIVATRCRARHSHWPGSHSQCHRHEGLPAEIGMAVRSRDPQRHHITTSSGMCKKKKLLGYFIIIKPVLILAFSPTFHNVITSIKKNCKQ